MLNHALHYSKFMKFCVIFEASRITPVFVIIFLVLANKMLNHALHYSKFMKFCVIFEASRTAPVSGMILNCWGIKC
jgi:hypothetical protein